MVNAKAYKTEKKYLSAKENSDLNGKTAVIDTVFAEEIQNSTGESKEALCVRFKGVEKILALNQTNLTVCITAWGEDTDKWVNKKVSFTIVTTQMGKGIQIAPQ